MNCFKKRWLLGLITGCAAGFSMLAGATVLTFEGFSGKDARICDFTNTSGDTFGSRITSNGPMTYTGAGTQIIAFKRGNGWTPNVTLNWGNNTQPRFDFWDNWDGRGAVAQIESDAERSNVDLVFTPDAGYGVRINSFELDAWNDGGEMIVEWSVLSGMDLLASGTTYLSNSGERKIVQTGLNNQDISLGQPVTLGFKPRSGKVNYLAMDNLDFDQFNDPALMKLSIMSFNVWTVEDTGAGVNKIVDIVRQSGADIVGFQELSNASAVAGALGWFVLSQSSSDVQIISRYPIIAESSASIPYKGAKIRVAAETDVWLFNCHLPAYPYQPEDLRDGKLARNEAAVIAAALAARGSQVAALTNEIIASGVINHYPTFVTGDFNEPSHLDWTQATADATPRDYDLAVNWPASSSMVAAGFTDSFRSVRGNPVSVPGYTWTPGAPPPQIDADEVLDRIDFVYAAGPQLSLQSSYNIGYTVTNTHTDIAIADYPSDHRAVLSTFYIPLLGKPLKESGQTTLTFEGKDRNKRIPIHWGSGVSTNEPGIKTVKEGTPHITLTWSTSADCKWEFYNDDEWSGAQMDNFEEGKTFDLLFTPADGYGVRVSSFVFDDYVNWYGGNRFNWALLEDNANGTVITSQTGVLTKDGEKKLISTGMFTPHYGPVLLRITGGVDPDSVINSDQALDNIVFSESQVPCLRTLILLK